MWKGNNMIVIDKDLCPQNHACPSVKVCPVDAITQDGFNLPLVDPEKCIKCKKCVSFCPKKAIKEIA